MTEVLTIYDAATDEERPATQDDIATLQRACLKLAIERDELRQAIHDLLQGVNPMAAPSQSSGAHKGASVSRTTAPHPDNSGAGALRAGIGRLNSDRAENKGTKPDRTDQSE